MQHCLVTFGTGDSSSGRVLHRGHLDGSKAQLDLQAAAALRSSDKQSGVLILEPIVTDGFVQAIITDIISQQDCQSSVEH